MIMEKHLKIINWSFDENVGESRGVELRVDLKYFFDTSPRVNYQLADAR